MRRDSHSTFSIFIWVFQLSYERYCYSSELRALKLESISGRMLKQNVIEVLKEIETHGLELFHILFIYLLFSVNQILFPERFSGGLQWDIKHDRIA